MSKTAQGWHYANFSCVQLAAFEFGHAQATPAFGRADQRSKLQNCENPAIAGVGPAIDLNAWVAH